MSPRSHTRKHKEMDVSQNLISLEVSHEQLETVRTALDQIEAGLPGLISLDPADRRGLMIMGPRSEPFARQTLRVLEQNPKIVPPSLDLAAAQADLAALDRLQPLLERLQRLTSRMGRHHRRARQRRDGRGAGGLRPDQALRRRTGPGRPPPRAVRPLGQEPPQACRDGRPTGLSRARPLYRTGRLRAACGFRRVRGRGGASRSISIDYGRTSNCSESAPSDSATVPSDSVVARCDSPTGPCGSRSA